MRQQPGVIEQHSAPRIPPLGMREIVGFAAVIDPQRFIDAADKAGHAQEHLPFRHEIGFCNIGKRILPQYIRPEAIDVLALDLVIEQELAHCCIQISAP